LLLAATVHSFAHMLLGISDRNNSVSEQTLVKGDIQLLFMMSIKSILNNKVILLSLSFFSQTAFKAIAVKSTCLKSENGL